MKLICLVAVGVLPALRTAAQQAPNGPIPYKFPERRGALVPPSPQPLQAAHSYQAAPVTVFPGTGHALPPYFPFRDYERAKRELAEKEMKPEERPRPPCQPAGEAYSEYEWTPRRHVSLRQTCMGSHWLA
ncbi:conserved hypothetical protein [Neospora caninum Liverpool]|uniref:Uncharacterized protein n=1 Tax=Neospora caninum (strain Liverpool) TaxID=572307 RepID=F0VMZ2_NEOCL|nr:conserved hypothetical protein [Neospora caninum Liverpool]CBZ55088.1 conserved hypothetical protein [Neospora caninum Liverpool]CEL69813.1 TPA: hypothetical protein BN1204_055130 [Neospora caninum Liverpool]|eukprot:XP_003885116.1 conserved hypothetical protein [Neospora caninum Liverpool]